MGCARTEPPGPFPFAAVDLTTDGGPAALASRARSELGTLDLLVLCAGEYGPGGAGYDPGRPSQSVGTLSAPDALEVLAVNAVAPLLTVQATLSLLMSGRSLPLVLLVSSRVGSLTLRSSPGDLYYAPSKAAANMAVRSLAMLDPLPATFVAVDPGWVRTAAGGHKATIEAPEAARALVAFIASVSPDHNGGFFAADGTPIPW